MLEMINQPISIHWETASIYVQLAIHRKKKIKNLHLNLDVY